MDSARCIRLHIRGFRFYFWLSFCISIFNVEKTGGVIISKLKRLIIPSVVFSIPYFFIFYDYNGILDFLYNIINGCGHMWYLPMLFWCFVGVILLQKLKLSDNIILLLFVLINLFWPYILVLQLGRATNYIFYFYLGFVIYKRSDYIKKSITPQSLVISWLLFLAVFIILRPLKDTIIIGNQNYSIYRLLTDSLRGACQLIYATLGTFTFYISMVYYTKKKQLGQFTVRLASCCFGIYLIHQFLLKLLYYNTNFSSIVGPYWLPWLGFILVLPISFYLSTLLLKTKMGKFFIG